MTIRNPLLVAACALAATSMATTASANCAQTDYRCKAVYTCYDLPLYPEMQAHDTCGTGAPVCMAYHPGLNQVFWVQCAASAQQAKVMTEREALLALKLPTPSWLAPETGSPTSRSMGTNGELVSMSAPLTVADAKEVK